jgi:hypothetical protein
MIHSDRVHVVLAVLGVALACAAPARAAWPPFGRAISTAPNGQTHSAAAPDGAGGSILVWQDQRDLPKVNLFAAHVLASGDLDPGWPVNGAPVVSNVAAVIAGGPFRPLIVSDGAGGAIVAWLDLRDSTAAAFDIYAQHVLASGITDPGWKVDGNAVIAIPGAQDNPAMVSDDAGGAILTWTDARPGASQRDIYAQHLLGTGDVDPNWPDDGFPVCTAAGLQEFPVLVGDGAGGAIIAWDDGRSGATGLDVYALHVPASGEVDRNWPNNGLALCTATGDQGRGTITSDLAGGAIVAWSDARVVGTSHIFAQHAPANGALDPAWPSNGRVVSNAGFLESRPLAVSDGAGGAIVSWQALAVHLNMYAQHIGSNGVVDALWPAGGRALSITPRTQSFAAIATDGAGGAIVAWEDSSNVVAQHVLLTGVLDAAYPDTGRVLVGLPSEQGDPAIVATGGAGAIVAWTDARSGRDIDIFAIQVLAAGTVGVTPPPPSSVGVAMARPAPDPARTISTIRFTLTRTSNVRLDVYDAGGRRVRTLLREKRTPGTQSLAWDLRDDQGRAVGAGLYLVRLEADGHRFTEKLTKIQ